MGYTLTRRSRSAGEMVSGLTGVAGADVELAVLDGAGHVLELIQYNAPADRRRAAPYPWDTGAAHIALNVDDIDAAIAEMTRNGWKLAGTVVLNPRSQRRIAYIRDWDGVMVELIELPAAKPQAHG